MNANDVRAKWHQIDEAALKEIEKCRLSPGIHQLGTTALPLQIQQMPGAVSYFVSVHSTPITVGSNTIVGGELAVVRTDSGLHKAYNYVFGSSNDGNVYFNGPHFSFPQHHFASTDTVSVEQLFGHVSYSTKCSL